MNTRTAASDAVAEGGREGRDAARRGKSLKKRLVHVLDRPGGRFLLGSIATYVARSNSGEDIAIKYASGLWMRRIGNYFLPDGHNFEYVYDFRSWKEEIAARDAAARDYWLRHYQPQDGDVIVDVGAGRGEDTMTFSRAVGVAGRVIAIEADPVSFRILSSFCKLNGLKNVTPIHAALMDKPGIVTVVATGSSWTENSVRAANLGNGAAVAALTLDDVCRSERVHDIAFLKMNIEGAERLAIAGMESVIACVRQICIACHDFRWRRGDGDEFRTREHIERFLKYAGFDVVSRSSDPRDYVCDHLFGVRRY